MTTKPQSVSELCDHPAPATPTIRARQGRSIAQLCLHLARTWNERGRQRQALANLDRRLLKDIGITRFDAAREAAKPFWRK